MWRLVKKKNVIIGVGVGVVAGVAALKVHKGTELENGGIASFLSALDVPNRLIREVYGKEKSSVKSLLDGSTSKRSRENRVSACSNLSGVWRNQLGSTVTIQQDEDSSKITGRYYTAVESKKGAAALSSDLTGLVEPVDGGSLVAFNVLWNKGQSLTAWVGECLECNNEEKLYTSWVLRSLETPQDRWMSTRINHDTFWRIDPETETIEKKPLKKSGKSDLLGKWAASTGDSFYVKGTTASDKELEGSYPSESKVGSPLFGQYDGDERYTAVGMVAAEPSQIKGWTGHIYNPHKRNKVLETSWLSHGFCAECQNPRKYVQYGKDDYSKN